jgi:hypothetical protein
MLSNGHGHGYSRCDSGNLSLSDETTNKNKFFIYNRGTKVINVLPELDALNIKYDVFGEGGYPRYRDNEHIAEYKGIIHFPYQTNIMSLWENLGYGNIYFIPSQKLIRKWISETSWYYWEEKHKSRDVFDKSIELAEWYQPENSEYFIYFDDWNDLLYKINTTDYIAKKNTIFQHIIENNTVNLQKWREILL